MTPEQKRAIKDLLERYHLGDYIYHVRENTDMTEWDGNTWDHPNVLRFAEILKLLEVMAKND